MEREQEDETLDQPLTADELAADLADILYDASTELTRERAIVDVRPFFQDDIRFNEGLTVRLSDGTEFQVTIVRST